MTVNPFEVSVRHSLHDLYQHMTTSMECIPEDTVLDEEDLSPQQLEATQLVEAIEQEWILDPEIRREVSMLKWDQE